jgi:putative ABC transport system ATP-binding protein
MIVKTENLTKEFGEGKSKIVAVDNVSIQINKGEFTAITGKSGSGKSTLLYHLALLDKQTSGKVYFDGKNTANFSSNKRRVTRLNNIGYVFQDYSLIPALSAQQNVYLPLLMQGLSSKEALEISSKVLSKVGLKGRLKNLPGELSGGEKQRVGIARAIAKKPKIIIADEPTANLDSKTSKGILDLFKELHKKGQTIVMVTHEQDYAKKASKIYTMKDGKLS